MAGGGYGEGVGVAAYLLEAGVDDDLLGGVGSEAGAEADADGAQGPAEVGGDEDGGLGAGGGAVEEVKDLLLGGGRGGLGEIPGEGVDLGYPVVGQGGIVEPGVDLSSEGEVGLVVEGLDEAGDEALDEVKLLTLAGVEGVVPAGLPMTDENYGLLGGGGEGGEEGSAIRGLFVLLVLTEELWWWSWWLWWWLDLHVSRQWVDSGSTMGLETNDTR